MTTILFISIFFGLEIAALIVFAVSRLYEKTHSIEEEHNDWYQ